MAKSKKKKDLMKNPLAVVEMNYRLINKTIMLLKLEELLCG